MSVNTVHQDPTFESFTVERGGVEVACAFARPLGGELRWYLGIGENSWRLEDRRHGMELIEALANQLKVIEPVSVLRDQASCDQAAPGSRWLSNEEGFEYHRRSDGRWEYTVPSRPGHWYLHRDRPSAEFFPFTLKKSE